MVNIDPIRRKKPIPFVDKNVILTIAWKILHCFSFVRCAFLEWQWSPQQIAERLRLEHAKCVVSYATIYRAIYAGLFDTPEQRRSHGCRGAARKLRHHGKSRHTKDYEEHRGRFKASHPRKIYRKRPLNTDNTNQACTADPSAVQVWYSIVTH